MVNSGREIKALFLTKYSREGASTRYRFLQYFPYLESAGIRCTFSPFTDASYLKNIYATKRGSIADYVKALARRMRALFTVREYDVVVIEYEILPYFPPIFERMLNWLKIPYIVNYDDAIFYRYTDNPNIIVRAMLGDKIATVMRKAAIVIAGNQHLADYAIGAGAKLVEKLPTAVDITRYPIVARKEDTVFTIGWIGSPSTAKYLKDITPALAEVCRNGKGKVVLIGSGAVELIGVPVEVLPWSEETEVPDLQSCDVGIMPLDEGLWEKGKCGLKIIQYMASSLPVVASPVGVNREIVEEGVTGMLASCNKEWVSSLTALREDKALRQRLGSAGRKLAEDKYSVGFTAPKIASLIIKAAEARNP